MVSTPAEKECSWVGYIHPNTDKVIHRDHGALHLPCPSKSVYEKKVPALPDDTCAACRKTIDIHSSGASAINTDDGMYHVACFSCILCCEPIGDHESIQYIRTKKGLYCTTCSSTIRSQQKELRRKDPPRPSKEKSTQVLLGTRLLPDVRSKSRTRAMSLFSSNTHRGPPTPPPSARFHGERPPKLDASLATYTSTTALPSPTSSSSYMSTMSAMSSMNLGSKSDMLTSPSQSSLQDFSSLFSADFLDTDSLSNLTSSLGANLSHVAPSSSPSAARTPKPAPLPKVSSRAADLLSNSLKECERPSPLRTASSHAIHSPPQRGTSAAAEAVQLHHALDRLSDMEANFAKLKEASQRALQEFERDRKEFEKEIANRQHLEKALLHVQRLYQRARQDEETDPHVVSPLDESEINHLARMRVELEKTCNELKSYRDGLAKDVYASYTKQAGLADDAQTARTAANHGQQGVLDAHIQSLVAERDALLAETENLTKARDEVLQETLVLNVQNAELSSMNNDLSTRLQRRSEESNSVPSSPLRTRMSTSDIKLGLAKFKQLTSRKRSGTGETLYGMQNMSTMSVSQSLQSLRNFTTSPFKLSHDGGSRRNQPVAPTEVDPVEFVRHCVETIEILTHKKGPEEGLYRKSGSSSEVNKMMIQFKQGTFRLSDRDDDFTDVNAITHVLKRYLSKELQTPVIPREFLESTRTLSIQEFSDQIETLPVENKEILSILMHHLQRLHRKHLKETRMDASKLGLVFGPTLTHVLPTEYDMWDAANSVTEYMIQHADKLLPEQPLR